jgi:hypothetical protein
MKLFFITVVLTTATFSAALGQSEMESVLAKLINQADAQYNDGTIQEQSDEKLTIAEVQELKDILEDLLRQTNAVSTEGMSAEMQGFWNVLKRGLGSAFRIAHRGIGFLSRNIAPLFVQPGQQPRQQYPMPPGYQPRQYQPRTRIQPKKKRTYRSRGRGRRQRGQGRQGRHEAQAEQLEGGDYVEKQVLSSLQDYDDDNEMGSMQQYDMQQYDIENGASNQQYNYGSKEQYDYGSKQQYKNKEWDSLQRYDMDDDALSSTDQYDDNREVPDVAKAQFFRLLGGLLKKLFG